MVRIPLNLSVLGVEEFPEGMIVRKKTDKIHRKNILGDTVICPVKEYIPFPIDENVEYFISGYALMVIQDELQGRNLSIRKFSEYVDSGLITQVNK